MTSATHCEKIFSWCKHSIDHKKYETKSLQKWTKRAFAKIGFQLRKIKFSKPTKCKKENNSSSFFKLIPKSTFKKYVSFTIGMIRDESKSRIYCLYESQASRDAFIKPKVIRLLCPATVECVCLESRIIFK